MIGAGFYLLARPPASVYFIVQYLPFSGNGGAHSGVFENPVFGSLPMFFHVCAFTLLTAGCFRPGKRVAAVSSLFWLLVNVVFEILQKFDQVATALIPAWFDHYPWLESFRPYFQYGTFDPFDLLFALFGAGTAYWILVRLMAGHNEEQAL